MYLYIFLICLSKRECAGGTQCLGCRQFSVYFPILQKSCCYHSVLYFLLYAMPAWQARKHDSPTDHFMITSSPCSVVYNVQWKLSWQMWSCPRRRKTGSLCIDLTVSCSKMSEIMPGNAVIAVRTISYLLSFVNFWLWYQERAAAFTRGPQGWKTDRRRIYYFRHRNTRRTRAGAFFYIQVWMYVFLPSQPPCPWLVVHQHQSRLVMLSSGKSSTTTKRRYG